MTRLRSLIALGALVVALGAYLVVLDDRMRDAGGPGMVAFEFAATEERAAEYRADWGADGRDAARRSLWADFPYLLAYGAFLVLAAAATRDLARSRGRRRMAAAGVAAVPFAAGAAAFDALEDINLLLVLDGHGGEPAPALAAIFAGAKFLLLAAVLLYLVAGVILRLRAGPAHRTG